MNMSTLCTIKYKSKTVVYQTFSRTLTTQAGYIPINHVHGSLKVVANGQARFIVKAYTCLIYILYKIHAGFWVIEL